MRVDQIDRSAMRIPIQSVVSMEVEEVMQCSTHMFDSGEDLKMVLLFRFPQNAERLVPLLGLKGKVGFGTLRTISASIPIQLSTWGFTERKRGRSMFWK